MEPLQPRPRSRTRTFVGTLALALIAFGVGYGPKEWEARKLRATLKETQLDLRLSNLHRLLGVASQEAQRNNYAAAADAARAFFDGCRALSRAETFEDEPRTRTAIASYGGTGDAILSQLAAGDPAVKEQLAGLYLAMDGVLHRRL